MAVQLEFLRCVIVHERRAGQSVGPILLCSGETVPRPPQGDPPGRPYLAKNLLLGDPIGEVGQYFLRQ